MGPFSGSELLVILIILLIVLGPKATRDLARSLGSAIRQFNRAMDEAMGKEEKKE
ncbi:MAG: twin-arginine translocase TatA/TatE family subunit [Acidilobaceae archaeon]|nr:twin-arginine translocase TatA/TatE family subunit [Acidilobaceae archaeon]MCX8165177.1 twin-arginine translocase TatA/TatE family subunit [Acidilobaceae archaeon]MDW7974307.1 twin-arginine translocase TatA/TatE family subunit [Sulfolobales archaeon]